MERAFYPALLFAYPMIVVLIIQLHFEVFGGYEVLIGRFSVDWLGLLYVGSSSLLGALICWLVYFQYFSVRRFQFAWHSGIVCIVTTLIYHAIKYGVPATLAMLTNKPLHFSLVAILLFSAPTLIFSGGEKLSTK